MSLIHEKILAKLFEKPKVTPDELRTEVIKVRLTKEDYSTVVNEMIAADLLKRNNRAFKLTQPTI